MGGFSRGGVGGTGEGDESAGVFRGVAGETEGKAVGLAREAGAGDFPESGVFVTRGDDGGDLLDGGELGGIVAACLEKRANIGIGGVGLDGFVLRAESAGRGGV